MSRDPALPLFGTDGIRKVVGTEITPAFIARVITAYATWVDGPGPVLIAHDYRTSSDGIARICSGTLQMNGVDVFEMGVMPTPSLQFNVLALRARAGLMVTASHNPTEFNGIKFCGPQGLELPHAAERAIESAYERGAGRPADWSGMGRIRAETEGINRYLDSIVTSVKTQEIRARPPSVVLDCGNGTSASTAPHLLHVRLGCGLTTLNANPDGSFPGHPSEPTRENLVDLARIVPGSDADIGVAFDGDSDRVAFVDESGNYIPGETVLALFARDVLRQHPRETIVTSITSSSAVADVVRAEGGNLVVTRSGSLPVAEGIAEHHAPFGGEENGHFYWPAHQNAPDGPMSCAKMIELLAREGRPLSELVRDLPSYCVVKEKVPLPPATRSEVMLRVAEVLEKEADRTVTIDGVKAFFPDGWVLVRPSGTEPICRIFAESKDMATANRLSRKGIDLINGLVRVARESAAPTATSGLG
jgi:phosphomannomutase / phosphoglucomutase